MIREADVDGDGQINYDGTLRHTYLIATSRSLVLPLSPSCYVITEFVKVGLFFFIYSYTYFHLTKTSFYALRASTDDAVEVKKRKLRSESLVIRNRTLLPSLLSTFLPDCVLLDYPALHIFTCCLFIFVFASVHSWSRCLRR